MRGLNKWLLAAWLCSLPAKQQHLHVNEQYMHSGWLASYMHVGSGWMAGCMSLM